MPVRSSLGLATAIAGALVVLFLATPIATLLVRAAGAGGIGAAVVDPAVQAAFRLTAVAAAAATAIGLVVGVPLGYVLARGTFRGREWLEALVELPVVIPHPVAGIAILLAFGRLGPLGRLTGASLVGSSAGIVACMLFVGLPFLVAAAREGFALVDPRLEAVARTLGVSPLEAAVRVALPLAARSIVSGAVLMWARAVSEFGAIAVVAYHPRVASILVYDRFTTAGLAGALPVAALLVVVALLVFTLLRTLARPLPALR